MFSIIIIMQSNYLLCKWSSNIIIFRWLFININTEFSYIFIKLANTERCTFFPEVKITILLSYSHHLGFFVNNKLFQLLYTSNHIFPLLSATKILLLLICDTLPRTRIIGLSTWNIVFPPTLKYEILAYQPSLAKEFWPFHFDISFHILWYLKLILLYLDLY